MNKSNFENFKSLSPNEMKEIKGEGGGGYQETGGCYMLPGHSASETAALAGADDDCISRIGYIG